MKGPGLELPGGHILPHIDQLEERHFRVPTETELAQFREIPSMAVDPIGAHEIDDAFHIEREHGKTAKFTGVIARAGLLPPDSQYVAHALDEGWSHYPYEGYQIPMLKDDKVASDYASLKGGELRPAVAFTCEVTLSGRVLNRDIEFVKTRTDAMSYGQFGEELAQGLHTDAVLMHNILRQRNGNSRMPIKTYLRKYNGPYEASEAYAKKVISEFMLFTNEQIGLMMHEHGIPWIYRYFDPSDRPDQSSGFEDIEEHILDMVEYLSRAFYTIEPRLHKELGKDNYSHNTSPLRRAADLFNHMILEYVMSGGDPDEVDLKVLQNWVDRLNILIAERADKAIIQLGI